MNTKWKKILCLPLSCVLMMGFVSGCGSYDAAPSTEPTATEPDPNKPLKVFTIGNAASLDF